MNEKDNALLDKDFDDTEEDDKKIIQAVSYTHLRAHET